MTESGTNGKIRVKCPKCSKRIGVPRSIRGRTGRCPGCGTTIKIPTEITSATTAKTSLEQVKTPVETGPPPTNQLTPPVQTTKRLSEQAKAPDQSPASQTAIAPTAQPAVPKAGLAQSKTQPFGPDPIESNLDVATPSVSGSPPNVAEISGQGFFQENWATLIFWLPCALLCLMAVLHGAVSIIGYSSGPSDMAVFLAKRMLGGLILLLAGLLAYGISSFSVTRFCKRKNRSTRIVLYLGCWLCMLGVGFALLVFGETWKTAWLAMFKIWITSATWIFAWTLVTSALILNVLHLIKAKSLVAKQDQADPLDSVALAKRGFRKFWWAVGAVPFVLMAWTVMLSLVFLFLGTASGKIGSSSISLRDNNKIAIGNESFSDARTMAKMVKKNAGRRRSNEIEIDVDEQTTVGFLNQTIIALQQEGYTKINIACGNAKLRLPRMNAIREVDYSESNFEIATIKLASASDGQLSSVEMITHDETSTIEGSDLRQLKQRTESSLKSLAILNDHNARGVLDIDLNTPPTLSVQDYIGLCLHIQTFTDHRNKNSNLEVRFWPLGMPRHEELEMLDIFDVEMMEESDKEPPLQGDTDKLIELIDDPFFGSKTTEEPAKEEEPLQDNTKFKND